MVELPRSSAERWRTSESLVGRVREMAKQFSEIKEKADAEAAQRKYDDLVKKVKDSKILPALKEKLLEPVVVDQFSEEKGPIANTVNSVVRVDCPRALRDNKDAKETRTLITVR